MNVAAPRRRAAAVTALGAVLLRESLAADSAGPRFYLAGAALAGTWLAGARWAGAGTPHPSQPAAHRTARHRTARHRTARHRTARHCTPRHRTARSAARSGARAAALGVGAFGVFYAGARLTRRIPFARTAIAEVLRHERVGSSRAVLALALTTGAAEECFFRGVLYDLAPAAPVRATTAAYTLVTCASGNPALVFASAVMGPVFAANRAAGAGVRGSVLTHVVWSSLMLRYLPPMFARNDGSPRR